MDYETANNLLKELSDFWIRKTPLSKTISYYRIASNVIAASGIDGDAERAALANLQIKNVNNKETEDEMLKIYATFR